MFKIIAAGVIGLAVAGGAYAASAASTPAPHYAQLTPECSKISDAMHTVYSNTDIAADMIGLLPALTDIVSQLPATVRNPRHHSRRRRVRPVAAHLIKVIGGLADGADQLVVLRAGLLTDLVAHVGGDVAGLGLGLGTDALCLLLRGVFHVDRRLSGCFFGLSGHLLGRRRVVGCRGVRRVRAGR